MPVADVIADRKPGRRNNRSARGPVGVAAVEVAGRGGIALACDGRTVGPVGGERDGVFDRLVHADWSVAPGKRWMAVADRTAAGWVVGTPVPVGATGPLLAGPLLDRAFAAADQGRRVLAGFDFPIGVPAAYGARTGCADFPDLLRVVGTGAWRRFFDAACEPAEIAIGRPFYPSVPRKGVSRGALVGGLGVPDFEALLRICERGTADRRGACALFWTLGGNQVGKAAISGWREVIRPALGRGAALWPFAGTLADLASRPGVVLAETYPADAYRMVGAGFARRESKRRQADRRAKSDAVLVWAARHGVGFGDEAAACLVDGFGAHANGEDRFDALMGLLKMIEVADGRRPARTRPAPDTARWEGWILGR